MSLTAMQAKLAALSAQATKDGVDLTVASKGGTSIPLPEAGACRWRLIEYTEYGIHDKDFQGKITPKPYCRIGVEITGPKHPLITLDDGRKIAHKITIDEVIGNNEKNTYHKIFKLMSVDYPNAKNFFDLLAASACGLATIFHGTAKSSGKKYATLKNPTSKVYTFASKSYENPASGEVETLTVAPLVSDVKYMGWAFGDVEMWDMYNVDGTYDDGAPKNWMQEKMKRSQDWPGSALYVALCEAGREAETVPNPKWGQRGGAAAPGEQGSDEGEDGTDVQAQKAAALVQPVQAAISGEVDLSAMGG